MKRDMPIGDFESLHASERVVMTFVARSVPFPNFKDKWIELERKRWATLFSIPVADRAPDGFPVLTLAVRPARNLSFPDMMGS